MVTQVYRHLCCRVPTRLVRVGYVSFMPNGDITVGLTDRKFYCKPILARQGVFSYYNPVITIHDLPSHRNPGDTTIVNPHFTFHAPSIFQLTSPATKKEKALYRGVTDPLLALDQLEKVPWVRAITQPIKSLPCGGIRHGSTDAEQFIVTAATEDTSILIAFDFVRHDLQIATTHDVSTEVDWHGRRLSIGMSVLPEQDGVLSWAHVG